MDTVMQPARRMHRQRMDGLPNKLRKLRVAREMTMPELAEEIGVTVQALHQAEIYGTGIGKDKWYRLADFFDMDPRLLESP